MDSHALNIPAMQFRWGILCGEGREGAAYTGRDGMEGVVSQCGSAASIEVEGVLILGEGGGAGKRQALVALEWCLHVEVE